MNHVEFLNSLICKFCRVACLQEGYWNCISVKRRKAYVTLTLTFHKDPSDPEEQAQDAKASILPHTSPDTSNNLMVKKTTKK